MDSKSMNLDVEKLVNESGAKNLHYVSTDELGKYINFRSLLSSINKEEATGFEVNGDKGEITLSNSNTDKKDENTVSEQVTVKSNEKLVDGKVVPKEEKKASEKTDKVLICFLPNFPNTFLAYNTIACSFLCNIVFRN